MEDWVWITIIGILALLPAYRFTHRWWRMRQVGKQADELLASIVKGKDSFRR